MKIAIITSVSGESAQYLADCFKLNGIQADVHKPWDSGKERFYEYDSVFSLGCSAITRCNERFNLPMPVKICVNKVMTFEKFRAAGVPTVEWTTDWRNIKPEWHQVCVRSSLEGRKAEGLEWHLTEDMDKMPKNAALYTRCFYGNYEYRVVYAFGEVFVYYKRYVDGDHHFILKDSNNYKYMVEHAKKAAKAIGVDYVGFDVIAENKRSYAFLEANSGAMMTEEVALHIVEFFLNRKA